ncbi:MAG TPA: hypothetical protein PKD54_04640, partial [Pirellulaceae bacterium]|nr:hypothetical protein [Pirellulaceae bacterium]
MNLLPRKSLGRNDRVLGPRLPGLISWTFHWCQRLAAAIVMLFSGEMAQAQFATDSGSIAKIIQTGDALPGGIGTYTGFVGGHQFGLGHYAFAHTISNSPQDQAIVVASPSGMRTVFRTGDSVANGGSFLAGQLNFVQSDGTVALTATLSGTGGANNDTALFLSGSGGLVEIAREGAAFGGSLTLGNLQGGSLNAVRDAAGRVYFQAPLNGPQSANAIIRGNGASLDLMFVTGDNAAGNGTFLDFSRPAVSGQGTIALAALLSGTSGGASDNRGVFRLDAGGLTEIVRKGTSVPDNNGTFNTFTDVHVNNAGLVAFRDDFIAGTAGGSADRDGVFLHDGNQLRQLVRSGQTAPDNDGVLSNLELSDMNEQGSVLVRSTGTKTSLGLSSASRLLLHDQNTLRQLAATGDAADQGGFFGSFSGVDINDNGLVLMTATISLTPGGSTTVAGVFLTDGIETIRAVGPNDILAGSTVQSAFGASGTLNEHGQFTFGAALTGGSNFVGVYTPALQWRSGTTGSWDDSENWTLGITPGDVHDLRVNAAANISVQASTEDAAVRSLEVGTAGIGTVRLILGQAELAASAGVTIGSKGILSGSGQVNGDVLVDGGRVAPGTSIGVLSFQESLNLAAGS